MAAREAFQKGNIERLSRIAPELAGHPLSRYITYWQLRSRLNDDQPRRWWKPSCPTIATAWLTERMRADWLRALARNQGLGSVRARLRRSHGWKTPN